MTPKEKTFYFKKWHITIYAGIFVGFGFNIMKGMVSVIIPFVNVWICKN